MKNINTLLKKNFIVFTLFFLFEVPAQENGYNSLNEDLKIWFNKPAADWNEALPVGNGSLGAMIFGGTEKERLQLNEETVWRGKPEDFVNPGSKEALPLIRRLLFEGKYKEAEKLAQEKLMGNKKTWGTYQTLGDLFINFDLPKGEIKNYRRELDLQTAVARISFEINNVNYCREIFSSAPDKALIIKLSADKKSKLNFEIDLNRPGNNAKINIENNLISLSEHTGEGEGVILSARLKVNNSGGKTYIINGKFKVEKADEAILILTAATDYWKEDPYKKSMEYLTNIINKNYDDLKEKHIKDYQKYFNRLTIDLGATDNKYKVLPTDERLISFQNNNKDSDLIELYFQFGRYLLISSSRPGGLPANLQGIWADGLTPPWSADYHININIQMNYWPAEITNLSEMHLPFLEFISRLISDGKKTAENMYGISGAAAHFTTDAWLFTEPYGETKWAMWPMGLAWCTQHLWEHYLFTEDKIYLIDLAYPVMKEASVFCTEWLVENPVTKKLVSGPSISPENSFITKSGDTATVVMGPAMDHMIIRNLLTNTITASEVLNIDSGFRNKLEEVLNNLAPTRIGSDGRIMEWTEEFEEPEPGHRHISHLFGLHPGDEITYQKTPELIEAARKTIEYRLAHGSGHTGWSRAWIINFFARLQDGNAAYKNLSELLKKSTLPNLLDTHPPFQIDGNFGAAAGIAEMLLQSHAGEIHILPALPDEWQDGHIHRIAARGGYEISIDWENGKLKSFSVFSKFGNSCKIRYADKTINLNTEKDKTYLFNNLLKEIK